VIRSRRGSSFIKCNLNEGASALLAFDADAVIDGDTVVVKSNAVAAPVAVRYAWNENPQANLWN
jgi:hypothetical protein